MAKFKDSLNREWDITLNLGMIEDINDQTEVDFDVLISSPESLAKTLFENPRKLGQVLWVIVEEQAKTIGSVPLTPRAFANSLTRDCLDKAIEALMEAILVFYQRSAVGKVLREKLPAVLAKMDQKLTKMTTENLDKALSNMDTDLPG